MSYQNQSSQRYNRQAAKTDSVGNDKEESNLSKFWRECRERDIRKRKRIYDQYKRQSQDNFASTVNQLKTDAQILSTKFAKLNSKKKDLDNKFSNQYQSINPRQSKHRQSMHAGNVSMNIGNSSNFDQNVSYNYDVGHNDDKENKMEQSENLRIFFENKKYSSSLHHKYLNSKRSINIQSVYDYFDSFKNDENNLKTKLRQKWQDLKKDVDASFSNYFNKRKGNKPQKNIDRDVLSNTYPLSHPSKTTCSECSCQSSKSSKPQKPSKPSNLSRPRKSKTQNIYNNMYNQEKLNNDTNIIFDTKKNIMNEQKDPDSQPITQSQSETVFQSETEFQSEIMDDIDKENNVHDDTDDFMNQIKNDQDSINDEIMTHDHIVNNQENAMNLDKTRAASIEKYEQEQDQEQEQASSMYSVSHLQKSNEYWDFSVRQLKQKLLDMNVSINECIEKKDLIQKIKAIEANSNDKVTRNQDIHTSMIYRVPTPKQKQQQHVNLQQDAPQKHQENKRKKKPSILYDTILYDTRESKQQIMNRVDLWIHRWSYRRSFRQLLNSILGYKSTDQYYITRGKNGDQNHVLMMKLYREQ